MRIHPALLAGLIVLTGCAPPAPISATGTASPRYGPGRYQSTPAPAFETQSAGQNIVFPPRIRLVDEAGEMFEGMQSSFCWPQMVRSDGAHSDLCADYVMPEKVTIQVAHPAGAPIEIRFEGPPPDNASVVLWDATLKNSLANDQLTVSGDRASWLPGQPPGDYVLQVSAFWQNRGDTSMLFGLILQ